MHRENCLQTRLPPTFAKRKTTAAATGWSHSRRLSICRAALNRVVRPRPASRSRRPRKYRALEPAQDPPAGCTLLRKEIAESTNRTSKSEALQGHPRSVMVGPHYRRHFTTLELVGTGGSRTDQRSERINGEEFCSRI